MRLVSFYRDIAGMADGELSALLAGASRVRHMKKGELLIRAGEEQTEVSFLVSGLMRSYVTSSGGHEHTDCIVSGAGVPIMPCASIVGPSPATIETLEESEVVSVGVDVVMGLLETNLALNQAYNRMLQEAWQRHWDIKEVMCRCRSRERYLWFLKAYPGLIERVPLRHVASFLGMTPVTLSRLRSKLSDEVARDVPAGVVLEGE